MSKFMFVNGTSLSYCLGMRSCLDSQTLAHNGPAIWGGCVTRREHRQSPDTLARKLSRYKEGMAQFLPVTLVF